MSMLNWTMALANRYGYMKGGAGGGDVALLEQDLMLDLANKSMTKYLLDQGQCCGDGQAQQGCRHCKRVQVDDAIRVPERVDSGRHASPTSRSSR